MRRPLPHQRAALLPHRRAASLPHRRAAPFLTDALPHPFPPWRADPSPYLRCNGSSMKSARKFTSSPSEIHSCVLGCSLLPEKSFLGSSPLCVKNIETWCPPGSSLLEHAKFTCVYWDVHFCKKLVFCEVHHYVSKTEKSGVRLKVHFYSRQSSVVCIQMFTFVGNYFFRISPLCEENRENIERSSPFFRKFTIIGKFTLLQNEVHYISSRSSH